jgi:hypothetical protein
MWLTAPLDVGLLAQSLDPLVVGLGELHLPELLRQPFARLLVGHGRDLAAVHEVEQRAAEGQHQQVAGDAGLERSQRVAHPRGHVVEVEPTDVAAVLGRDLRHLPRHLPEILARANALQPRFHPRARRGAVGPGLLAVGDQQLPHAHRHATGGLVCEALLVQLARLALLDAHLGAHHGVHHVATLHVALDLGAVLLERHAVEDHVGPQLLEGEPVLLGDAGDGLVDLFIRDVELGLAHQFLDEPRFDQLLQGGGAHPRDLGLRRTGLPHRRLLRPGHAHHLGDEHDAVAHLGGDAVHELLLGPGRRTGQREGRQAEGERVSQRSHPTERIAESSRDRDRGHQRLPLGGRLSASRP